MGHDRAERAGQGAGEEFDAGTVAVVSAAHCVHDAYPAFIGVLLPLLIAKFDIGLAMAGFLASGVRWTILLQPMLGWWSDRSHSRAWVVVPPATTAVLMSSLGIAPGYIAVLALLLLTGVSHAAFHPAAGAMVTRASGHAWGRGMSWFMTGGELGRVVGPLSIAALVGWGGLERSWIALVPGVGMSLLLYRYVSARTATASPRPPGDLRAVLRAEPRLVAALAAVMVLRSVLVAALVTFYPTLATSTGAGLVVAGLALSVYEGGATLGAFAGGTLSDRFGQRRVLALGLLTGLPAVASALLLGPSIAGVALLAVGAFAVVTANPVELVMAQRILPDNRGVAIGLTYFAKTGGAIVGTLAVGALAQAVGLRAALLAATAVAAIGLPLVALLREQAPVTAAAA